MLYAMLVLSHIGKNDREEKEEHGTEKIVCLWISCKKEEDLSCLFTNIRPAKSK